MARRARRTQDTRTWVDALVRSGLGTPGEVREQLIEALRADLRDPEPETTAAVWIADAVRAWRTEAETWPEITDFDRLQQAFADLETGGVVVLQGCADHWSARDVLATRTPTPVGIVWFTAPDVWHAVDEGMLEVNLWHPTTANAAPGDQILDETLAAFARAGLEAHFDEGRIEVAAHWQRRPW